MKKVNIFCSSYNHENFIEQTLQGFVMQKTNFDFEAIIADDCSTDNTPKILKKYADKYPKIIKPILRSENIGIEANFFTTALELNAEYIALCEGDDYFTDEYKLQKQVDFLDAHPECSICCHSVREFYEDGSRPDSIFPPRPFLKNKTVLDIEDLLENNFIQTNSAMYRWRFNGKEQLKDIFPTEILPIDWFLHLLHAQKGKIGFIDEVMSAYRRHPGGIWWEGAHNLIKFHLQHGLKEVKWYIEVEKTFPEYQKVRGHIFTLQKIIEIYIIYLVNKQPHMAEQVIKLCPEVISILEQNPQILNHPLLKA